MHIAGRAVGTGEPCYVIAEAGVNHDGSLDKAIELADVAKRAGADAVKFQSFDASALLRRDAAKPAYQIRTTGAGETQFEMLQRLELSAQDETALADHCRAVGITFLSTPYDVTAVRRLVEIGVPAIKIASCDVTHGPLLVSAARAGLPVIVSTGAATLDEVRQAVALLVAEGSNEIIILQCTTSYPAPTSDVNLAAMATLRELGTLVGFSDHSTGSAVAVAAAALGAVLIEKHFTLDRSAPGPDHAASLEPDELSQLVAAIREVESAIGDGTKEVRDIEVDTRRLMRRSIVAARNMTAGTVLGEDDVAYKRPGTGTSPMEWRSLIGGSLTADVAADDQLGPDVVSNRA